VIRHLTRIDLDPPTLDRLRTVVLAAIRWPRPNRIPRLRPPCATSRRTPVSSGCPGSPGVGSTARSKARPTGPRGDGTPSNGSSAEPGHNVRPPRLLTEAPVVGTRRCGARVQTWPRAQTGRRIAVIRARCGSSWAVGRDPADQRPHGEQMSEIGPRRRTGRAQRERLASTIDPDALGMNQAACHDDRGGLGMD